MWNSIEEAKNKLKQISDSQTCCASEEDYIRFEQNKKFLFRIAEVENSSLTVLDLYKKNYLLVCYRFNNIIGYSRADENIVYPEKMFELMHPDDILFVLDSSVRSLMYMDSLPAKEKTDYKLITEFRLKNIKGGYSRFVQQLVVLELDKQGNIWLVLKIIDLISETATNEPPQRKLINMKSGKLHVFEEDKLETTSDKILTTRELEILGLISQGLASKEISERLFISVNTVNNHRQNILSKTKSENSAQALNYARKIGIV